MITINRYYQDSLPTTFVAEVDKISHSLLNHLSTNDVLGKIEAANQPGNSSAKVQDCFIDYAESLGFHSEKKGLFKNATNQLLRPDYFLNLQNGKGIILEVERGKVTINNMDLLDMWKCHLCEHADVLFLMVPNKLRQNPKMSPRKEFNTVSNRLGSFFEKDNYTNVKILHVFGY